MMFLPSVFDAPHDFKYGIYTFVVHPNTCDEESINSLSGLPCTVSDIRGNRDLIDVDGGSLFL